MRRGQNAKSRGDWQMNRPPLFNPAGSKAIPKELVFYGRFIEAIFPKVRPCFLHPVLRPLNEIFSRQATDDVHAHGQHGQPSEDGIEMNAYMDENECRSHPCQAFMHPQQAHRV